MDGSAWEDAGSSLGMIGKIWESSGKLVLRDIEDVDATLFLREGFRQLC
jgi:hypothetical protein